MGTWKVYVDEILEGPAWPARVSVPLCRGSGEPSGFSVVRPDGSVVPAQWRALVSWPDGSPRWVQLDFYANSPGRYLVEQSAASSPVDSPVRLTRPEEGRFVVSIGRLEVVVAPASGQPVERIRWKGHPVKNAADRWDFFAVDTSGRPYELAANSVRNLRVECDGPLRFQVAWETELRDSAGQALLAARFRVEFLAGVEGFTLQYQFFHTLPRHDFLHLGSMYAEFPFEPLANGGCALAVQPSHGLLGATRIARLTEPLRVRLDRTHGVPYVEDLDSLADETAYPYFLEAHARNVGETFALVGSEAAVAWAMEDLACHRPKEIVARPGELLIDLWPEWAGPLTLPQGRSCSQRFGFAFADPSEIESVLQRSVSTPSTLCIRPAVAWLDATDSTNAGLTWDQQRLFSAETPGGELFSGLLSSAASALHTVGEMFHYGDTPGHDYSVTYTSVVRYGDPSSASGQVPFNEAAYAYSGLVPRQNLEPAWMNNEYDVIYCLALESLRTRSAAALRKLRAAARHQIEVDFVHYSDHWQHHRGTPCHTYGHVLHSTAYPSHQWTQGLYYYYCLAGDDDVPEVVRAICDFNIRWFERPELQFAHGFNRELGWGALALVFGYELTGDDAYREASRSILQELETIGTRGAADGSIAPQHANSLGAAFATNTIPMAVKAYHQATGDPWAREFFLKLVDAGYPNFQKKSTGTKLTELFPESLAYACELTGDTTRLEETLWQLKMFFWLVRPNLWNIYSLDNSLYGKTFARAYRGLVHYLSACARAGILEKAERMIVGVP